MENAYEIKSGIFITKSGEAIEVKDGYWVKNMTLEEVEKGKYTYFPGNLNDARTCLYIHFNPEYEKVLEAEIFSPNELQTIFQDHK